MPALPHASSLCAATNTLPSLLLHSRRRLHSRQCLHTRRCLDAPCISQQVPSLGAADAARLWSAVAAHVAEACLEGFSRCKRCSLEGRAAMSLDLQVGASRGPHACPEHAWQLASLGDAQADCSAALPPEPTPHFSTPRLPVPLPCPAGREPRAGARAAARGAGHGAAPASPGGHLHQGRGCFFCFWFFWEGGASDRACLRCCCPRPCCWSVLQLFLLACSCWSVSRLSLSLTSTLALAGCALHIHPTAGGCQRPICDCSKHLGMTGSSCFLVLRRPSTFR